MKADQESEIIDEIKRIKDAHNHFIKILLQMKSVTMEESYIEDYENRIRIQAPWITPQLSKNISKERTTNKNTQIGIPTVSSTISEQIDNLIKKIAEKSDQKGILLQNFLIQFKDLGESDRIVLVESFKSLDPKKLKLELEKLRELFT